MLTEMKKIFHRCGQNFCGRYLRQVFDNEYSDLYVGILFRFYVRNWTDVLQYLPIIFQHVAGADYSQHV